MPAQTFPWDKTVYLSILKELIQSLDEKPINFDWHANPHENFYWTQMLWLASVDKNREQFVTDIALSALDFIRKCSDSEHNIKQIFLLKLNKAINKHPQFDEGPGISIDNALLAVNGEIIEWLYALKCELPERQIAEAYDVLVTGIRFLNHEYE